MNEAQITLASKSPRRADLLQQIGIRFNVRVSGIPESPSSDESPEQYVKRLALSKAKASYDGTLPSLGADTTVVLNGQMLEKPLDFEDAQRMLRHLQGSRHTVLTAIAMCDQSRHKTVLASAEVRFRPIDESEIRQYCYSDEPFDKAGAYGIQGIGAIFTAGICGQPSTVAGLPLVETNALLIEFGVDVWRYRAKAIHETSHG